MTASPDVRLPAATGEALDRLDAVLEPPAAGLIAAYFDSTTNNRFAAEAFDTIGENDPLAIGPDDLLATTMLDIRFSPASVRPILGPDREALTELLRQIPSGTDIWQADDDDLANAEALWKCLRTYHGIDWVVAGKLMARKRPRLIPIIDSVVTRTLRFPKGTYWATLREALADPQRRKRIEALRPPGLTPAVSTLRLLDVAVWMRGSDSANARAAQTKNGLTPRPRVQVGR
jgi:hypothetical protein